MTEKCQLSVIIPVFNEADNLNVILPPLIKLCQQNSWNILVINDGSSDNTKEVLSSYSNTHGFKVILHKLNRGYGAAIKSGIRACETEYCITFDADGQHRLEDIERLNNFMLANDADMVIGSRKGVKSVSYSRGFAKSVIRLIAKILMNVPVHDLNSGMKVYRTDLAQKYIGLAPDTMSYSDVITLIFISHRHLVLEESITIKPRLQGKSTIGIETAFQTIMEIINIVILFNPMKIFLPISIICFLFTLGWGIPLAIHGYGVSTGTLLGFISGIIFFLLGLIAEQLSMIRKKSNN